MARRSLESWLLGDCRRSAILWFLLLLATPAGATLIDVEPANDSISTAPIQLAPAVSVTIDAGEFVLVAGDIDFVGISNLVAGDIVTVTTTPLDDADLEVPDTIVGLFDSSTTDPTSMILCRGDDTQNNDLITGAGGIPIGYGSLCRFGITVPGTYYVGVTGFRSKFPPGCDPAAGECSSFPFDGGIGPTPCEEAGPTYTCGNYQVTIAVNGLPEPGAILQLVSGGMGLAWLNRRRNRRRPSSSQRPDYSQGEVSGSGWVARSGCRSSADRPPRGDSRSARLSIRERLSTCAADTRRSHLGPWAARARRVSKSAAR